MLGIIIMSGNVESLTMRKCTRCLKKYPVDDWGTKPNGDYYQYCNVCRVENRDDYRRKALVPEFRERCKEQHRENYNTQDAYDNRQLRVKCPICNREVFQSGLSKHNKSKVCRASVLDVVL